MPGENFRRLLGSVKCCATCQNAYQEETLVCTIEDKTGAVLRPDVGDDCDPVSMFDLCDAYRQGKPHGWEWDD